MPRLVLGSAAAHAPPAPGRYVTVATAGERFKAFVPAALPPKPPLEWSSARRRRFDDALLALGRLNAITALLPDASLRLHSFVRKEAVLSSQIEGCNGYTEPARVAIESEGSRLITQ